MKITVLASGSKGNCTLIETNKLNILIDCGITLRELYNKVNKNNIKIDIIFITHSHIDHISGLNTIYKRYKPIIFTRDEKILNDSGYKTNYLEETIIIEDIEVTSFNLSHDNPCVGLNIKNLNNNKELVYITDTGYINKKILTKIVNKDMYIIESNHDIDMLMHGKYPFFLQQRILGDKGHLSNKDCCRYLSKIIGNNTNTIVLAHLSEENNTPTKAKEEIEEMLITNNIKINNIYIAKQREKLDEIEV